MTTVALRWITLSTPNVWSLGLACLNATQYSVNWEVTRISARQNPTEKSLNIHNHHLYSSMIGGLAYLATCSRPYISCDVSSLPQNLHKPTIRHILLVKRLFSYLNGTMKYGNVFPPPDFFLPKAWELQISPTGVEMQRHVVQLQVSSSPSTVRRYFGGANGNLWSLFPPVKPNTLLFLLVL